MSKFLSLRNAWRVLSTLLFATVLVGVVGSAVVYMGLRISGIGLYAVTSPSMQPTFGPRDVVGISHVDPWDIKVGDIVAYVRSGTNIAVVHRVKEVRWVGYDVNTRVVGANGKVVDTPTQRQPREFVFQGDNNPTPDPGIVQQSQIIGRERLVVPHPFNLIATRFHRQALIIFGAGAIVLYAAWEVTDAAIKSRRARNASRFPSTTGSRNEAI